MGKKLTPNQMELYKRIDEILFYKWDPIGISDSDWARVQPVVRKYVEEKMQENQ
jgi:hypothetical protein